MSVSKGNGTKKPVKKKTAEEDQKISDRKSDLAVSEEKAEIASITESVASERISESKVSVPIKAWTDKDEIAFARLSDSEKEVYLKAVKNEPMITNDLEELVQSMDGELAGLEYRIKSPSSVCEKIYDRPNKTDISEMNDIVRYTVIKDKDNLAECTQSTLSGMEDRGYKVIKVKNTWLDDTNPYKGINTQLESEQGQKFELQFHTQESFDVKNSKEMHGLYEQARVTTDAMEAKMLKKKMFALSAPLEVPFNIESI